MENIVELSLKDTFLIRISDLNAKKKVLDYLNQVSRDDSIKTIIILGASLERETRDYLEFYRELSKWISDQGNIQRIYNAIDQFILTLRRLSQVVIHVDRRKRISTFLNWSFACDYRIVAHNAVFQNTHLEMGLIPKGGNVYFLSRMLGFGKAVELLLSNETMTASKALSLHVVNELAPWDQLEITALKTAHRLAEFPFHALSGIKRLMSYGMKDLEDFLSYENDELFRIVNQPDFQKMLAIRFPEHFSSLP
jgi:2-(1,2-epoxy-1,2-dihydrophenyl)acetyl-CoA isomerase